MSLSAAMLMLQGELMSYSSLSSGPPKAHQHQRHFGLRPSFSSIELFTRNSVNSLTLSLSSASAFCCSATMVPCPFSINDAGCQPRERAVSVFWIMLCWACLSSKTGMFELCSSTRLLGMYEYRTDIHVELLLCYSVYIYIYIDYIYIYVCVCVFFFFFMQWSCTTGSNLSASLSPCLATITNILKKNAGKKFV